MKILVGILALVFLLFVAAAFVLPITRNARPAALRSSCKNNLKQIGIALHNYNDAYGCLPPPYTVDADGNKLHSWRTLILPYMEQQALYEKIDLSKPWDDPANSVVRETLIHEYHCPSDAAPANHTNYLVIVGEEFAFSPTGPRKMEEFRDGLSETIFVLEVPEKYSVEWMSPEDGDEAMFLSLADKGNQNHNAVVQVVLGDGSVRVLSVADAKPLPHPLLTIAGDDDPGEY